MRCKLREVETCLVIAINLNPDPASYGNHLELQDHPEIPDSVQAHAEKLDFKFTMIGQ
ncbi:unnamed protein product, partial [Nesidiocoris tenuis]